MTPEPALRMFPGGGRVTVVNPGGSGPTIFEVAWRNPSPERLKETQAFWDAVNGHLDPFWFDLAGTRYEPCHFEPGSLKRMPTQRPCHFEPGSLKRMPTQSDRNDCLVVRFVGTKVAGDLGQKPAPPEQKGE